MESVVGINKAMKCYGWLVSSKGVEEGRWGEDEVLGGGYLGGCWLLILVGRFFDFLLYSFKFWPTPNIWQEMSIFLDLLLFRALNSRSVPRHMMAVGSGWQIQFKEEIDCIITLEIFQLKNCVTFLFILEPNWSISAINRNHCIVHTGKHFLTFKFHPWRKETPHEWWTK